MSMPDEPGVAYAGNGLDDVLMIFISMVFIRANIKFERRKARGNVQWSMYVNVQQSM
jgi:hypothetical protein